MIFVQVNGVSLTAAEPFGDGLRLMPNPETVAGIDALTAAMTGTSASPVMLAPPSLTPATAAAGAPVAVFLGTFSGTVPAGVLRMNGQDVTGAIANGIYIPSEAGTLTLTVTASPLSPVSVSAVINGASATAPGSFTGDQWTASTGLEPGQIVLNVSALPSDGGSTITAIEYTTGGPWVALSGTGTGPRVLQMPANGASYSFALRAVNATGPGTGSAAKSATSGAAAQPPATIDSVVVIGASLMASMFGRDLVTPHATATSLLAAAGHNLPVYGWALSGTRLEVADTYYSEARAAHPNALIIMHFGGNDVTADRPYPGGQANMNARLAELLAVAAGDTRFYPASISFRDYDDATFIDPSQGSKPYNENIIIPWAAANFPHSIASYGRPKLDFYRRVLQSYDTWLGADNIHPRPDGYTAFREWIMARVAEILSGVQPAEIPERTYVPPANVAPTVTTQPSISGAASPGSVLTLTPGAASGTPAPTYSVQWRLNGVDQAGETGLTYTRPATAGAVPSAVVTWGNGTAPNAAATATAAATEAGAAYPLTIVNVSDGTNAAGFNNVNGAALPVPGIANLKDTSGADTGIALAWTVTGNPTWGSFGGQHGGAGNTGRTDAPTYAGQLLAQQIARTHIYVSKGVSLLATLTGLVPNATYEVGVVGTRDTTTARPTLITVQSTPITFNAAQTTSTEYRATVTASASGEITILTQSDPPTTGSYGYLSGFSIKRLS